MFQGNLDEHHHVEAGLLLTLAVFPINFHALVDMRIGFKKLALPLTCQAGTLPRGVVEQTLTPNGTVVECITRVVDYRHAGPFAGG